MQNEGQIKSFKKYMISLKMNSGREQINK